MGHVVATQGQWASVDQLAGDPIILTKSQGCTAESHVDNRRTASLQSKVAIRTTICVTRNQT
jgi:hypothetical protein